RECRRRGSALPAPPAHGIEPEGPLDRPGALGLRAVLHGDLAALPDRERRLPPFQGARPLRQRGDAVGILLQPRPGPAPLRRPGLPPLPASLSTPVPAPRQARGDTEAERRAGAGLARAGRAGHAG